MIPDNLYVINNRNFQGKSTPSRTVPHCYHGSNGLSPLVMYYLQCFLCSGVLWVAILDNLESLQCAMQV